jgi:hypothetical protein
MDKAPKKRAPHIALPLLGRLETWIIAGLSTGLQSGVLASLNWHVGALFCVHWCRCLDVGNAMNAWDVVQRQQFTCPRAVVPFLFPIAVRFHVRQIYNYPRHMRYDVLSFVFCTSCMICQDHRQLNGIASPRQPVWQRQTPPPAEPTPGKSSREHTPGAADHAGRR